MNRRFSNLKHIKLKALMISSLFAICMLLLTNKVYALSYSLGVGPASLGAGGSNPPSGMNAYEYQGSIIFDQSEIIISVVPGIFYAWRSSLKGAYVSFGPGMVIDANGSAAGVTAGFGYNAFCENQCLNFEYRKGIGLVSGHGIAPYALRIGLTHILN